MSKIEERKIDRRVNSCEASFQDMQPLVIDSLFLDCNYVQKDRRCLIQRAAQELPEESPPQVRSSS